MKEVDLCNDFRDWINEKGFDCYPEVRNWDQVLVPRSTVLVWQLHGIQEQIGIQAKITANIKVLAQTTGILGPHYRCVLIPKANEDFLKVCREMRLGAFFLEKQEKHWGKNTWVKSPDGFFVLKPIKRDNASLDLELPSIIPNLPAGVKSPKQLTAWREGAFRICKILKARGYVTSADFSIVGISMTIWKKMNWLVFNGYKTGNMKHYKRGPGHKWPEDGWEEVIEQMEKAGKLDVI